MLDRTECTHLVLHFEIRQVEEMCIADLTDLQTVADLVAAWTDKPTIQSFSIRAGPLGHRAWKVTHPDNYVCYLDELNDPEEFERSFLEECGFLDV